MVFRARGEKTDMNEGPLDEERFYPVLAPFVVLIGWGIGMLFGGIAAPYGRFYSFAQEGQSFVPGSSDAVISVAHILITLCTNGYAGWLLALRKHAGCYPWVMLPIVLLMLGAEYLVTRYFISVGLATSQPDYSSYVLRSLPLGLRSFYLFFPFVGLGVGMLGGTMWRKRQDPIIPPLMG